MRHARMLATLALVTLGALAIPVGAEAHPLGNFTVNQYARVDVSETGLSIRYVLDEAEIPTFQARRRIDANHDGAIDAGETAHERDRLLAAIGRALDLRVDGRRLALTPSAPVLTFPKGQAGLRTTRLVVDFRAERHAPGAIELRDTFASGRIGWREILVAAAPGIAVDRTTASTTDRTGELRHYPQSVLSSPADMPSATIAARRGSGGVTVQPIPNLPTTATSSRPSDRFASLIETDGRIGLAGVLTALGLALVFGMLHALSPGHGKTMVAAYLAGSRGSAKHALALGATVTVTHTAGVFALGLVTLSLSQFILPEQLYPWLTLASGVLVLGLGTIAIRDRVRRARRPQRASHAAHDHSHDHDHDHDHDHGHDHGHDHDHGHHHHDVPDRLSWRSLIALGVSGGLLPCPSALIVLLSAIALHRLAFGMALIAAFSLGLSAVISGVGLIALSARRLFARLPSDDGRVIRALPVVSALVITVLGIALTARALPAVM